MNHEEVVARRIYAREGYSETLGPFEKLGGTVREGLLRRARVAIADTRVEDPEPVRGATYRYRSLPWPVRVPLMTPDGLDFVDSVTGAVLTSGKTDLVRFDAERIEFVEVRRMTSKGEDQLALTVARQPVSVGSRWSWSIDGEFFPPPEDRSGVRSNPPASR